MKLMIMDIRNVRLEKPIPYIIIKKDRMSGILFIGYNTKLDSYCIGNDLYGLKNSIIKDILYKIDLLIKTKNREYTKKERKIRRYLINHIGKKRIAKLLYS